MNRETKQIRSSMSDFKTRSEGEELIIEGYFAVFNETYNMAPGLSESIAPGAFSETLGGDVRALVDHNSNLVLGRNKAGTLFLKEDSHGLWGEIRVNPKDSDATNLYERVNRGDVDQCSFGFEILDEETEFRDDDSIHWTIRKVKLWEVSVCTFPAYDSTAVSARKHEAEEIRSRKSQAWKERMLKRLKGE